MRFKTFLPCQNRTWISFLSLNLTWLQNTSCLFFSPKHILALINTVYISIVWCKYSNINRKCIIFFLLQTTIKVYANCLRPDIEYKTLSITYETTCREVVQNLLNKYRMRHRDPRLFYLTMEVTVRRANVRTILPLDEDARPAVLQSCHPRGDSKYVCYARLCLDHRPFLGFGRLRDVISGLATVNTFCESLNTSYNNGRERRPRCSPICNSWMQVVAWVGRCNFLRKVCEECKYGRFGLRNQMEFMKFCGGLGGKRESSAEVSCTIIFKYAWQCRSCDVSL